MTLRQALNNKNFEKEFDIKIINNDTPISFTTKDYKVIEGLPYYTDARQKGKSGAAVAIISPNTLAVYTSENIDYPNPINWSKTIKEMKIYNKSHIIGYSLSAKNANENNIFIGTEYLNKTTMKNIETEIYNYIKKDKRIFLYKVTPQYKFKEDIIPLGILIEAETIDNKEKISICRFCYNIQKGIKINYYDGSNMPIESTYGKRKANIRESKIVLKNKENNKYKDYEINIKTKTFHLKSKHCSYINNVNPKYIQETKAYEEDIINRGFKLCKKCTKYYNDIKQEWSK